MFDIYTKVYIINIFLQLVKEKLEIFLIYIYT